MVPSRALEASLYQRRAATSPPRVTWRPPPRLPPATPFPQAPTHFASQRHTPAGRACAPPRRPHPLTTQTQTAAGRHRKLGRRRWEPHPPNHTAPSVTRHAVHDHPSSSPPASAATPPPYDHTPQSPPEDNHVPFAARWTRVPVPGCAAPARAPCSCGPRRCGHAPHPPPPHPRAPPRPPPSTGTVRRCRRRCRHRRPPPRRGVGRRCRHCR